MTDIRKGDLIKATLKTDPDVTVTTRILDRGLYNNRFYSASLDTYFDDTRFDFEVLERPIEEALLKGAVEAYTAKATEKWPYSSLPVTVPGYYEATVGAVIEFVRQYDKESSK